MKSLVRVVLFLCVWAVAAGAQEVSQEFRGVEQVFGRPGEEKDGVLRVTFPRSDLRVKLHSVTIRAGLALTSWAAFQKAGDGTMMMGDLVLLGPEVQPVISKFMEGGIEVAAIHNHLIGESPRVIYAHFHGHGDAAALAAALRGALATTATPLTTPRQRSAAEVPGLDAAKLGEILGRTGTSRGGVVSFGIPRAEKILAGGISLGPRMGMATAINFQADGSGAATTGDFVLVASEVQPVIHALRENGIEVTAVHNHMLDEEPRLFFLHFWGRDDAQRLARGLRAALDQTNHVKKP
jgi:hypothetical protein